MRHYAYAFARYNKTTIMATVQKKIKNRRRAKTKTSADVWPVWQGPSSKIWWFLWRLQKILTSNLLRGFYFKVVTGDGESYQLLLFVRWLAIFYLSTRQTCNSACFWMLIYRGRNLYNNTANMFSCGKIIRRDKETSKWTDVLITEEQEEEWAKREIFSLCVMYLS